MRRISLFLLLVLCLCCMGVWNHAAGGAPAAIEAALFVELTPVTISANDIVYDWKRDQLYASVSGDQGHLGNSIVPITPDGKTQQPIFIGSEPNVLALSNDADYLYVGLDGAAAVRRLNLTTMTADPQWPLGSSANCGVFLAEDMVVLINDANAVAVSRRGKSCWPSVFGAAVYDGGVMRAMTTVEGTLHNQIEPSPDPNVLFSVNTETSGAELNRLAVTSSGLTVEKSVSSPFQIVGNYFYLIHADGELYGSDGRVVDGATLAPLGEFHPGLPSNSPVAPDPEAGRVFFLTERSQYLKTDLEIFDRATFKLITSAELPNFSGQWPDLPVELLLAGPDRLAFRTANGGVYWLTYHLLENTAYLPVVNRGLWEPGSQEGR